MKKVCEDVIKYTIDENITLHKVNCSNSSFWSVLWIFKFLVFVFPTDATNILISGLEAILQDYISFAMQTILEYFRPPRSLKVNYKVQQLQSKTNLLQFLLQKLLCLTDALASFLQYPQKFAFLHFISCFPLFYLIYILLFGLNTLNILSKSLRPKIISPNVRR